MISHLEGKIIHVEERFAVLQTGGVGYKIFATTETLEKLRKKLNQAAVLWTHLAVRENALDLYGFPDKRELDFFELLITISGIGPKTALSILNVASADTIRKAVSSNDTSYLTKVSGIGKKTADKIVRELEDKIGSLEIGGSISEEVDAVEALHSLGYSQAEARDALKKIEKNITGASDRVKAALKILGK